MPATIIVAEVMDSTDYPMMNVNFDDTAGFNNNEVSESELITSIDEEEILQNAEDEEDDLAVERATIVSVLDEEEYEFTTIINLEGMYIYCDLQQLQLEILQYYCSYLQLYIARILQYSWNIIAIEYYNF